MFAQDRLSVQALAVRSPSLLAMAVRVGMLASSLVWQRRMVAAV
jgi:hypothetical protein